MAAEDLISAIVADPTRDSAWCAYRDWLVARGELRGEIIRRELAGEPVPGAMYRDDEKLMAPRLYAQWHLWNLGWSRGFIRGARLMGAMDDPPALEAIDALFADPHVGLLSSLAMAHPISATVPLWQALLAEPRPSIRRLEANLGDGPDLTNLPNLEMFELQAYGKPSALGPAPRLVHRRLRTLRAGPISCRGALAGEPELPELEQLWWIMFEGQQRPLVSMQERRQHPPLPEIPGFVLFTSPTSLLNVPPPKLRELKVSGDAVGEPPHELTSSHIALLGSCVVLPQLRRLELVSISTDRVLVDLLAAAAAYRHLEVITISLIRDVSPETDVEGLRDELTRALPDTRLEIDWSGLAYEQRKARSPDEPPRTSSTYDADSRGPDGRIDAMGMWISGPRR